MQVSATSHSPSCARQTVPALPAGCWQVTCDAVALSCVQGLPSSVQAVPLAFLASAGHVADVPVQFSPGRTRRRPRGRRSSTAAKPSVGQVSAVPLQVSATSQAPADARQTVPFASGEQVPRWPARLQAPQVRVQAVSQQTPFAQNPVGHWLFEVHPSPNDAS